MAGLPPWLANKKPGNAAEDKLDGGKDDYMEGNPGVPKKAPMLKANPKKKGNVPPQFAGAVARRLGK